jgi:hypothetical protein
MVCTIPQRTCSSDGPGNKEKSKSSDYIPRKNALISQKKERLAETQTMMKEEEEEEEEEGRREAF